MLKYSLLILITLSTFASSLTELEKALIEVTGPNDQILIQRNLSTEQLYDLSKAHNRIFLDKANSKDTYIVLEDIKSQKTFNIIFNYIIFEATLFRDQSSLFNKIKNYIKEKLYKLLDKSFTPELTGVFKLKHLKSFTAPEKEFPSDANRFIAHAGGAIDGHHYTNSLEAINQSYVNGFRKIELDLRKTSDGTIVAVHEWDDWADETGYSGDIPPKHIEFMKQKLHGKYTLLDMDAISEWFAKHPDAVLVTDKINQPKDVVNSFKLKDQLIMEVFNVKALNEALELNILEAMPTHSLYLKIRKDLSHYKEKGVKSIALSRHYAKTGFDDLIELSQNGIKVYAYHINSGRLPRNEQFVACNELGLFYGFYADKWDFKNTGICGDKY